MNPRSYNNIQRSLYIILGFYYKSPRDLYINNHRDILALLDAWVISQYPMDEIVTTLQYPMYSYPDVCICGYVNNYHYSVLRTSCHKCLGHNPKAGFFSDYIFHKLTTAISYNKAIPIEALKAILTQVISDDTRNNRFAP
jgi:hypothetical protein